MPKENDEDGKESGAIPDTGKDIKKEMKRYQDKMMLGEEPPPAGDSKRSEE